jgi:hypothetical protein
LKMLQSRREAAASDSNSPKAHRREGYLATVQIKPVISLPHKRTEGHAPVWGSEFTIKVAHYTGGSAEAAARLN